MNDRKKIIIDGREKVRLFFFSTSPGTVSSLGFDVGQAKYGKFVYHWGCSRQSIGFERNENDRKQNDGDDVLEESTER